MHKDLYQSDIDIFYANFKLSIRKKELKGVNRFIDKLINKLLLIFDYY